MEVTCPCGEVVSVPTRLIGRKKYCSKKCMYEFRPKRQTGLKYVIKKVNKAWFKPKNEVKPTKGHLRRRINGKMQYVHRYKMERVLRRKLTTDEIVHHIDGNGLNNHLSNLMVMTVEEHDKLHNGRGAKALEDNDVF